MVPVPSASQLRSTYLSDSTTRVVGYAPCIRGLTLFFCFGLLLFLGLMLLNRVPFCFVLLNLFILLSLL